MTKGWLIPVGIGLFLLYQGSLIANAANQVSASLKSVRLNKSDTTLTKTSLIATISVLNPTPQDLSFNSLSGVVKVRNKQIAIFSTVQAGVTLAANRVTDIDFPIEVNNLTLLVDIKDIILNWKNGALSEPIQFIGQIGIGNILLPFDQKIMLSPGGIGAIGNVMARSKGLPIFN